MSAPFLPERDWAAPSKTSKSRRTLILWAVLLVMFLIIWQFLTPAERPASQDLAVPVAESSPSWSGSPFIFLPFVIAGAMILVFLNFLRGYRQVVHFNLTQEPGRLALAQRRFAEAVDLFRATLPRFAKHPVYRWAVVLHVVESQLKMGRLDDAIASCAEIERSRILLGGTTIRARLASFTSLLYALKGDVPLAEHWAGHARNRIAKNSDDRMGHTGDLSLAETAIACRRGDYAGALKLLDERWLELRYTMTADTMRVVEVLRAFAEAQGGVRASNVVAERLLRIEPVTKGEFAFLGVEWPEMKTFLAAHGLEAE
jgi:hypothetical protein